MALTNTSKRVRHKSRGHTTGLGICAYFAALFKANELVSKSKKMTDEKIAILVEREFPHRHTAYSFRGKTKKRTINEYRYRYNTGKFTGGVIPPTYSFRYNRNGCIVDGKTGKKELPDATIMLYQSTHRYWIAQQSSTKTD